MTNEIKPPKWPRIMPLLEEIEVEHGVYQNVYENGNPISDPYATLRPTLCGTTHCAVGHVAHAFGLAPDPEGDEYDPKRGRFVKTTIGWDEDDCGGLESVAPIGSPMHKFTTRFAINLGVDPDTFDEAYRSDGLRALEMCFEQGAYRPGGRPTEAETATAFNKAVRQSGYTKVVDR